VNVYVFRPVPQIIEVLAMARKVDGGAFLFFWAKFGLLPYRCPFAETLYKAIDCQNKIDKNYDL
jgi:hypothetical protein